MSHAASTIAAILEELGYAPPYIGESHETANLKILHALLDMRRRIVDGSEETDND